MKHLKTKLMAAVAMLLVATVMLTSASFAWFTISTNPEVANLKATINSNENLEIALDGGSGTAPSASAVGDSGYNETWGNLVDLKTYFANASIALKPVLPTVATDKKSISFAYPKFGLDGRIKETAALTRLQADDGTESGTDKTFLDFGGVFTHGDHASTKTGDPVWCFEVDYWLRSNQALNVGLSEATARDDSSSGEDGLGSWVSDKNITVAIVDATDGAVYYGIPGTAGTDGNFPLTLKDGTGTSASIKTISLTANTAKLIKMYVYLDGSALTNEDMIYTSKNFTMNVQFTAMTAADGTTAKDLSSLVVAEADNGRKAS